MLIYFHFTCLPAASRVAPEPQPKRTEELSKAAINTATPHISRTNLSTSVALTRIMQCRIHYSGAWDEVTNFVSYKQICRKHILIFIRTCSRIHTSTAAQ